MEENYNMMIQSLFQRFPSFQKAGSDAYKPGIANMEFFDALCSHPHRNYRIVHVAGTNGKGSVSNMLASVISAGGLSCGLYTSPHILDFRERMRIKHPDGTLEYVSKEYVMEFIQKWNETFDHLKMSFFEITTVMALCWFADRKVDAVVLETGLGGRLDSTNIVSPSLSVITNIGLDHCDLLGDTLEQIAFEKAGIIKPKVKAVVGESNPATDAIFERKVLYTNLPEPEYMGDRNRIMSLLTFADKVVPGLWDRKDEILCKMDLQGCYQKHNLRTVLCCVDRLKEIWTDCNLNDETIIDAIEHTAKRMDFHGRWEKLSGSPLVICDIGHNSHGLKYNFSQLERMLREGECGKLVIVYGSVADKDVDAVMDLFPDNATFIFTNASTKRALDAGEVMSKYLDSRQRLGKTPCEAYVVPTVKEAVAKAMEISRKMASLNPLVYIGGSTYVVSEAVECF